MSEIKLRDIEGYKEFKSDVTFFKCEKEYPGWTGTEKYGIITDLSKEEFEKKYPQFVLAMTPYILLDRNFNEIRNTSRRNDDKYIKRNNNNHSFFEIDNEAEAMHLELTVPDFVNQIFVEQEEQEEKIHICHFVLSKLTNIQRKYLIEYYVKNKKITQIAKEQGCSQPTVSVAIENAKKKFIKIYKKNFKKMLYFDTSYSIHNEGANKLIDKIVTSKKNNEIGEVIQNETK